MQADMSKTWLSYYSIRKEPLMVKKKSIYSSSFNFESPNKHIFNIFVLLLSIQKKIFFTLKNMDVHCIKRVKNEISFILEIMLCNYTKP